MNNKSLVQARANKNDEFYTDYFEAKNEIETYLDQLKGAVVYCPCDSPDSKIVYYLADLVRNGTLKALVFSWRESTGRGGLITITPNGESLQRLENGSFDSPELVDAWNNSDIVITNPPFSLFIPFYECVRNMNKRFLLLGALNKTGAKSIANDLLNGCVSIGNTKPKTFHTPDGRVQRLNNCVWFTNLKTKPKPFVELTPDCPVRRYENIDAVESIERGKIPETNEIIAVPVSFLEKYNPEQFEIIAVNHTSKPIGNDAIDDYRNNGGRAHVSPAMFTPYYRDENGRVKFPFSRVFLRLKKKG